MICPNSAPEAPAPEPFHDITSPTARSEQETKSLARQLLEALGETETQFGKLPLFARPLARNGFKTKSGKTLQEWKIRIEQMIIALEAESDALATQQAGSLNREQLSGSLLRLRNYYAEEPDEVARFSKDPGVLQEARALSARRTTLIDDLITSLDLTP